MDLEFSSRTNSICQILKKNICFLNLILMLNLKFTKLINLKKTHYFDKSMRKK